LYRKLRLTRVCASYLQVGTLVDARWEGRARMFPGVVTAVNEDGTYAVQYNDGDFGGAVAPSDVQTRCPAVLHVPILQRWVVGAVAP
jgi:hypothetical protein